MTTLTLNDGFVIENPPVTVPWGLSKTRLIGLLGPYGLRRIGPDYFVISCTSLGGLLHELGFHYDSNCRGIKYWLEFFRTDCPDVKQPYDKFQRHLEATFGPPTVTEPGEQGLPYHRWEIDDFIVQHSVYKRFMLSQAVTIKPQHYGRSVTSQLLDTLRLFFWLPPMLLCPLAIALVYVVLCMMHGFS